MNATAEAPVFSAEDPACVAIAALCREGWSDPDSVADVLNSALRAGYTIAAYPIVLRKMRIDPGECVILYNCDAPREQLAAIQAAMVAAGAPPKTIVIALPPGQSIGLLTDAELASAGLARVSRIIIPR